MCSSENTQIQPSVLGSETHTQPKPGRGQYRVPSKIGVGHNDGMAMRVTGLGFRLEPDRDIFGSAHSFIIILTGRFDPPRPTLLNRLQSAQLLLSGVPSVLSDTPRSRRRQVLALRLPKPNIAPTVCCTLFPACRRPILLKSLFKEHPSAPPLHRIIWKTTMATNVTTTAG